MCTKICDMQNLQIQSSTNGSNNNDMNETQDEESMRITTMQNHAQDEEMGPKIDGMTSFQVKRDKIFSMF